ncbi:uncharacterized protein DUF4331 [Shimia isoporae]|uniref:Uncharacterized protein DUF4331 n=1 Tax=Shimia isoporae TaxID=647720 RepID=A0A4R1N2D4_9RHOB|nr:DUF4331 family protein [Shimia isoporae]TCL00368.1 uncharacterized protein DUF4331 [Shimia isoporae]
MILKLISKVAIVLGGFGGMAVLPALASDHKDSPYTQAHPEADIGDIFIFKGPQTGGLTMAFTVNPLSGSGAEGTNAPADIKLDASLTYIYKLDLDGDLVADVAYKVRATDIPNENQQQKLELRRATGADAVSNMWNGDVLGGGLSNKLNRELEIVKGDKGELLFVGPRRDPFFFDFLTVDAPTAMAIKQALAGGDRLPAKGSAELTFGRTDMTLVVLEVPELAETDLRYWVVVADESGKGVDRMGRAGTQGIFFVDPPVGYNPEYYLPRNRAKYKTVGDFNDAYNATAPKDDRKNYGTQLSYRFEQLEVSAADIAGMVDSYLPDVIHWSPNSAPGYPNGRNLREDAIYWIIQDVNPFLVAADGVNLPHVSTQRLSPNFPYVAPSIEQAFKPGSLLEPVFPIYMD